MKIGLFFSHLKEPGGGQCREPGCISHSCSRDQALCVTVPGILGALAVTHGFITL